MEKNFLAYAYAKVISGPSNRSVKPPTENKSNGKFIANPFSDSTKQKAVTNFLPLISRKRSSLNVRQAFDQPVRAPSQSLVVNLYY